ncbi:MAG TPA: lamin tail domain-containing protein [Candidatus Thermoplasmatota archaeon]|nr:lamin tail domain-containing protein [Candidatus Thermoplasmatota archaeon]
MRTPKRPTHPLPAPATVATFPTAIVTSALLLVALASVPFAAAEAPTTLRIAELLPIPDATQGQREFIEVWNPTAGAIELAGWKIRDAPTASGSSNEFTFGSGRLAPGGRIVVWSNGSGDARGPSWSTSASKTVWNDAGDAATLVAPNATVADWMAYGNSAAPPPAGFGASAKPAAPARGLSIALNEGAWSSGAPTPAMAPGTAGGTAGATVLNVAPDVRLSDVPATAKPGQSLSVQAVVTDANGAADIVEWRVTAGGATVAEGVGARSGPLTLVAPAVSGPWTVQVTATDAGGLAGMAKATIEVRDARLSVVIPGGMLRFPDLRPGDADVTALDWATVRNEGLEAAWPLLDVSPFGGPAGEIPVDGNLLVGLQPEGGNVTWVPYGGPLSPLPSLGGGSVLRLSLRLQHVPTPLAAGTYGTTFAVVAA